eukprot:jgi/Mesvir1/12776/Mv25140-RA.1
MPARVMDERNMLWSSDDEEYERVVYDSTKGENYRLLLSKAGNAESSVLAEKTAEPESAVDGRGRQGRRGRQKHTGKSARPRPSARNPQISVSQFAFDQGNAERDEESPSLQLLLLPTQAGVPDYRAAAPGSRVPEAAANAAAVLPAMRTESNPLPENAFHSGGVANRAAAGPLTQQVDGDPVGQGAAEQPRGAGRKPSTRGRVKRDSAGFMPGVTGHAATATRREGEAVVATGAARAAAVVVAGIGAAAAGEAALVEAPAVGCGDELAHVVADSQPEEGGEGGVVNVPPLARLRRPGSTSGCVDTTAGVPASGRAAAAAALRRGDKDSNHDGISNRNNDANYNDNRDSANQVAGTSGFAGVRTPTASGQGVRCDGPPAVVGHGRTRAVMVDVRGINNDVDGEPAALLAESQPPAGAFSPPKVPSRFLSEVPSGAGQQGVSLTRSPRAVGPGSLVGGRERGLVAEGHGVVAGGQGLSPQLGVEWRSRARERQDRSLASGEVGGGTRDFDRIGGTGGVDSSRGDADDRINGDADDRVDAQVSAPVGPVAGCSRGPMDSFGMGAVDGSGMKEGWREDWEEEGARGVDKRQRGRGVVRDTGRQAAASLGCKNGAASAALSGSKWGDEEGSRPGGAHPVHVGHQLGRLGGARNDVATRDEFGDGDALLFHGRSQGTDGNASLSFRGAGWSPGVRGVTGSVRGQELGRMEQEPGAALVKEREWYGDDGDLERDAELGNGEEDLMEEEEDDRLRWLPPEDLCVPSATQAVRRGCKAAGGWGARQMAAVGLDRRAAAGGRRGSHGLGAHKGPSLPTSIRKRPRPAYKFATQPPPRPPTRGRASAAFEEPSPSQQAGEPQVGTQGAAGSFSLQQLLEESEDGLAEEGPARASHGDRAEPSWPGRQVGGWIGAAPTFRGSGKQNKISGHGARGGRQSAAGGFVGREKPRRSNAPVPAFRGGTKGGDDAGIGPTEPSLRSWLGLGQIGDALAEDATRDGQDAGGAVSTARPDDDIITCNNDDMSKRCRGAAAGEDEDILDGSDSDSDGGQDQRWDAALNGLSILPPSLGGDVHNKLDRANGGNYVGGAGGYMGGAAGAGGTTGGRDGKGEAEGEGGGGSGASMASAAGGGGGGIISLLMSSGVVLDDEDGDMEQGGGAGGLVMGRPRHRSRGSSTGPLAARSKQVAQADKDAALQFDADRRKGFDAFPASQAVAPSAHAGPRQTRRKFMEVTIREVSRVGPLFLCRCSREAPPQGSTPGVANTRVSPSPAVAGMETNAADPAAAGGSVPPRGPLAGAPTLVLFHKGTADAMGFVPERSMALALRIFAPWQELWVPTLGAHVVMCTQLVQMA